MKDLSIVIVNFNTREKLRMCLTTVFASSPGIQFEVFVVDNASSDGSVAMARAEFPKAEVIVNGENLGFSRANNVALRQASGRYLLLLNPDVEIMPDTFQKMLQFMDQNPRVGVAGCRVEKPDGSLDLACRRGFPDPTTAFLRLTGLSLLFPKSRMASYNLTYLPEDEISEVDSVMGAFLLIRREAMDQVGFLDEDYFMYGEDLDWCFRVKASGWRVVYAPITRVIHHKGSASRKVPRLALLEFHRAMAIFYDKHYRAHYGFFMNFFVKFGIWGRYLLKSLGNMLRREKYVSK